MEKLDLLRIMLASNAVTWFVFAFLVLFSR